MAVSGLFEKRRFFVSKSSQGDSTSSNESIGTLIVLLSFLSLPWDVFSTRFKGLPGLKNIWQTDIPRSLDLDCPEDEIWLISHHLGRVNQVLRVDWYYLKFGDISGRRVRAIPRKITHKTAPPGTANRIMDKRRSWRSFWYHVRCVSMRSRNTVLCFSFLGAEDKREKHMQFWGEGQTMETFCWTTVGSFQLSLNRALDFRQDYKVLVCPPTIVSWECCLQRGVFISRY